MKASEARRLRIEDRVAIHFSNTARIVGVVSRIEWPTFTIALVDAKGHRYHRTRKYKSVYSVRKEDRVPMEFLRPEEMWLQFPVNADYEIAADICADSGLDAAAMVLRDPRCNPNQLQRIDTIVVNRDTPHLEQFSRALACIAEFPPAHSKLQKYVQRLTELKNIGQISFRVRYDAAPVMNNKIDLKAIVS